MRQATQEAKAAFRNPWGETTKIVAALGRNGEIVHSEDHHHLWGEMAAAAIFANAPHMTEDQLGIIAGRYDYDYSQSDNGESADETYKPFNQLWAWCAHQAVYRAQAKVILMRARRIMEECSSSGRTRKKPSKKPAKQSRASSKKVSRRG